MGTGYVRQSAASITDGATIQASHFNNEYNQLESAFNATTGHTHDGTTGEGPLIILSGGGVGITGTLAVGNGGIGVTTLTDGGVLLGQGTSAVVAMGVLADGSIIVGDGATDPVAMTAFTNSTGFLIHERGGFEFDVSVATTDEMFVATSLGVIAIRTAAQVRAHLSVEVGTDVQAQSAHLDDLDSLGAVGSSGLIMQSDGAGSWAYVTASGAFQSQDDHLDDLAALATVSGSGELMQSDGAGSWAFITASSTFQSQDDHLDDLAGLATVGGAGNLMESDGAGSWAFIATSTLQSQDDVLDDIAALTAVADNEFIVGTGAGTYAHENPATARGSMSAQEDVITTEGDIVRGSSGNVAERLALGSVGQSLLSDGTNVSYVDQGFNRNVIINGNFDVWQRGTTFTSISATDYGPDRFRWTTGAGSAVVDWLQSALVPDGTSDFSLQVDVTTADAVLASSVTYAIQYFVEGYDALRFGFGTSDATQLTLSFWVYGTKTGIHCVSFRNSAGDRAYIVEYTIDVTNTWEKKTVTLTADTTGTWLTDTGRGFTITWSLGAGADHEGAADTWLATNDHITTNQVNVMDNAANDFHLSRIQLEIGSIATEFERRPFSTELALCQRYYQKSFLQGTAPAQSAGDDGTVLYRVQVDGTGGEGCVFITFPVSMRAAPGITFYNPGAANSLWRNIGDPGDSGAATAQHISESSFCAENAQAVNDGVTDLVGIHYQADSEL